MEDKYFGATEARDSAADLGVKAMVERALRPLAAAVGLDEAELAQAVDRDLSGRVARSVFDEIAGAGIRLQSARVLDMGAGLGHASVEAVRRGCDLIAIEPGVEWCDVVKRRLSELGRGEAIVGDGQHFPFPDGCFDLIVSIGVLEHVRRPTAYLAEAHRVLKPGGSMFLSCENYLSFWEPHYQLAWFPLLPKRLAAIYLRMRGRSSEFLFSSITYTTRLGVNWRLRRLGFQFDREMKLRSKLNSMLVGRVPRAALVARAAARVVLGLEELRRAFTHYHRTIVHKETAAAAAPIRAA